MALGKAKRHSRGASSKLSALLPGTHAASDDAGKTCTYLGNTSNGQNCVGGGREQTAGSQQRTVCPTVQSAFRARTCGRTVTSTAPVSYTHLTLPTILLV